MMKKKKFIMLKIFNKIIWIFSCCSALIISSNVKVLPYKHTTCIPRINDEEMVDSTWFLRGTHVVCLQGVSFNYGYSFLTPNKYFLVLES